MPVYKDLVQTVGHTPLVRLTRMCGSGTALYAKIEGRNPACSIKDRVAVHMLDVAEKNGELRPGMTIVEPTSGNTGIGLAFASAVRGYSCILAMPETMSLERRRVLSMLGAELILTPGPEGMRGAITRAEQLVASDPSRYFMPQQFANPANPEAHELTTGPEIHADTDGKVDVIVSGVGTGGTITGISRFFKLRMRQPLVSVAVEPEGSPVITQTLSRQPLHPGPHRIQGIGAGFIPKTLDLSLIDRVMKVTDEEAMTHARRLARTEGILCGISSGAALAAACRLSTIPEYSGKVIVVILPDGGERYVSSELFTGLDAQDSAQETD